MATKPMKPQMCPLSGDLLNPSAGAAARFMANCHCGQCVTIREIYQHENHMHSVE